MPIDSTPSANDPVLRPLLEARDDDERQVALETVIVVQARPVIAGVLGGMRATAFGDDREEVAATVTLRLVRRLRSIAEGRASGIESFSDFVARLTYNAVHDFLRSRFPERTRLKNRFRYVIRNDRRFVTWLFDGDLVVALARWGARHEVARQPSIADGDVPPQMLRQEETGAALAAVLARIGAPALLDDLVTIFAELWQVGEHSTRLDVPVAEANPELELATRRHLRSLWREIAALPGGQRTALLLNLRDRDGLNALALFVLTGATTVAELASAAGLTVERMWEIWDELPFDDLTIAGMLGVTRQQVINLRKSARERLARRMRE